MQQREPGDAARMPDRKGPGPARIGLPPRPQLDRLTTADAFVWATGIEDTFITAPWPGSGRTLDEYELTGHYRQWRDDLALAAGLGVRAMRYGVPWHRINPAPGTWDWEWADGPLEHLLALGVDPIVDLVHYGLPPWIAGAFLAPDFPQRMAEYAARLAERFRGRIRWYTPLNEPRITAWYCGKLGWWPPNRRGWRGFVAVLLAACRGICATVAALRAVDPGIVDLHVDATDLYVPADPTLAVEAGLRQELGFLALDLVAGRVDDAHPLRGWLRRHGAGDADLAWFAANATPPPVIGLNLYPLFSRKLLARSPRGLRLRMPYATADIIDAIAGLYWRRYRRPLLISETASQGARRRAWLDDSVAAVSRLREQGVPLVGYTWWPLFALVAWAWRQGDADVGAHLRQMGLWDLVADDAGGLTRVPTPLVDAYASLAAGGSAAVGPLRATRGDSHVR